MFDNLIFIIEILGTIAFSISGVLVAREKKMDIFGTIVLGAATAVGGGITRDLILGLTPPQIFLTPVYVTVSFITSCILFIWFYYRKNSGFEVLGHAYETVFNAADSFGLAAFSISGIETAINAGHRNNMFLVVFVGTITAVGGGILRDILAGQMPLILQKRVYAVAAIIGAIVFYVLNIRFAMDEMIASFACIVIVVLIRYLAIRFEWNLPSL